MRSALTEGRATAGTHSSQWPVLEFVGVGRRFGKKGADRFTALKGVDLAIQSGEFVCLLGPSGCGKSTLLELAAGLLKPTTGAVYFGGRKLDRINTAVGYVTQKDSLLPWRTVRRNVGLPLEVQGVSRKERNSRVNAVLDKVGLSGFEDRYPGQLSGGMLKRASIAQTLSYEPSTLLMDEPFGALDAQLRQTLQLELVRIWEQERCTIVFVTHDIDEALLLGDRVVVFGSNPGRILHVSAVDVPRPRTAGLLQSDSDAMRLREKIWMLLANPDEAGSPCSTNS